MRIPIRNGREGSANEDEVARKSARIGSRPPKSPEPVLSGNDQLPSDWKPLVHSISSGTTVHQRLLLVSGRAGPQDARGWLGQLRIDHQVTENLFPSQHWDVTDSQFKALVHLEAGYNKIVLTFLPSPNLTSGKPQTVSTELELKYEPLLGNPPLHLVLLCAQDSPGMIDAPPQLTDGTEENTHSTMGAIIRKMRLWAYLSQAFTSEQMYRHGFGRRTFRLDETWQPDTLSMAENDPWAVARDGEVVSRQTAKVHIVKCDKKVEELQDPELAQQNSESPRNGDLYSIVEEALRTARDPLRSTFPGCEEEGRLPFAVKGSHIAVLIVDSHWDVKRKLIVGHAALGGANELRFGIFGSHSTWSWPRGLEEVTSVFTNETATDTRFVANDSNESGKAFQACNIGQGAFLHEVGHALGCPHQSNGVMRRGYTTWNRCFMTRELSSGTTISTANDEGDCLWHRLDALRFRYHSCFRLPSDPIIPGKARLHKPLILPCGDRVEVQDDVGIAFVEIHINSNDECRAHLEWDPKRCPRHTRLMMSDLISRARAEPSDKICLKIFSANGQCQQVDDLARFLKESVTSHGSTTLLRGLCVGQQSGPRWQADFLDESGKYALVELAVRHGAFIDGISYRLSDGNGRLNIGGDGGGQEVVVLPKTSSGIRALQVRSGAWLDGFSLDLVQGGSSQWFGGHGGGPSHLICPDGYEIVGLHGTHANIILSLGLVLRKI